MGKILDSKKAQAFHSAYKAMGVSGGRIAVWFDSPDEEIFIKVYSEGDIMITRMLSSGGAFHEEYTSLEAFEEAYTFLL